MFGMGVFIFGQFLGLRNCCPSELGTRVVGMRPIARHNKFGSETMSLHGFPQRLRIQTCYKIR